MKVYWMIVLAAAVGLGMGLIGGFGLAAPVRTALVVIELDQITDMAAYESLKKSMSMQAVVEAQFEDGRYLARSEDITALDGDAPKGIVIISFDTAAKAKAYYENTKEITAMRMKAAKSRAFIAGVCLDRGKLASC